MLLRLRSPPLLQTLPRVPRVSVIAMLAMTPMLHNLFNSSNSLIGKLPVLEHCTTTRLVPATIK